jgi:hypothetical protein
MGIMSGHDWKTPDEAEDYCRAVEAYLCRKNDGHLVRIVGPAFEQVCGWSRRGVPLTIACRGIDRYFERYYAKGPRRRPVRVEFCEADVLDVFDDWRRAIGIPAGAVADVTAGGDAAAAEDGPARRQGTLSAHLERVIARLTAMRAGENRRLDAALDEAVAGLDRLRAGAKTVRGEARQALIDSLQALQVRLVDAARAANDPAMLRQIEAEATAELAPFRGRMPPEAYAQAMRACIDRIVRERAGLPVVTFE